MSNGDDAMTSAEFAKLMGAYPEPAGNPLPTYGGFMDNSAANFAWVNNNDYFGAEDVRCNECGGINNPHTSRGPYKARQLCDCTDLAAEGDWIYHDSASPSQKDAHIASMEMWSAVLEDDPNDEEAKEQFAYWYEVVYKNRATPYNSDYDADTDLTPTNHMNNSIGQVVPITNPMELPTNLIETEAGGGPEGQITPDVFSANEYCEECSYMEHDACPMIEGCPCCDNTRQGMMGAETFEATPKWECDECGDMHDDEDEAESCCVIDCDHSDSEMTSWGGAYRGSEFWMNCNNCGADGYGTFDRINWEHGDGKELEHEQTAETFEGESDEETARRMEKNLGIPYDVALRMNKSISKGLEGWPCKAHRIQYCDKCCKAHRRQNCDECTTPSEAESFNAESKKDSMQNYIERENGSITLFTRNEGRKDFRNQKEYMEWYDEWIKQFGAESKRPQGTYKMGGFLGVFSQCPNTECKSVAGDTALGVVMDRKTDKPVRVFMECCICDNDFEVTKDDAMGVLYWWNSDYDEYESVRKYLIDKYGETPSKEDIEEIYSRREGDWDAESFNAFSIDKDDEGKIHIENKCDGCGKEFLFTQNSNIVGGNRAGAIVYENLDGITGHDYPEYSPYGDLLCKSCWKEEAENDWENFYGAEGGAGSIMDIGKSTPLADFTDEELTTSSAIHGDFDQASLNYSGHQNLEVKAETIGQFILEGEGKCQSMETGKFGNHNWMGGPIDENYLENDYETAYGKFGIYCNDCGQEAHVPFDMGAKKFIDLCQMNNIELSAEMDIVADGMAVVSNVRDEMVGVVEVIDDEDDDEMVEISIQDENMEEIGSYTLDDGMILDDEDNYLAESKTPSLLTLGIGALAAVFAFPYLKDGVSKVFGADNDTQEVLDNDPELIENPNTGDLDPAAYEELVVESTGLAIDIIPMGLDGSFMGSRFAALPTERYVDYNDPGIGAHTDIAMNRDENFLEPEMAMVQASEDVKEAQAPGQSPYLSIDGQEPKDFNYRVIKETHPISLDPAVKPFIPQSMTGYTGNKNTPPSVYNKMFNIGVLGQTPLFTPQDAGDIGASHAGSRRATPNTLGLNGSVGGPLSDKVNANYTDGQTSMSLAQWAIENTVSQSSDTEAVVIDRSSGAMKRVRRV